MNWTNKFNIDPAIANAVMSNPYQLLGDVSVTGLLRPPQIAALERQHYGDLTEDVSDGLWRLLGRAVHHIIAEGRIEGAVQEQRLTTEEAGWTVSGTFDIYYDSGALKDFKCTSTWRYIFGGAAEWEEQLNLYALLARRHGLTVNSLHTAMILRDWSARRAAQEDDFPPIPFIELEVPLWTEEKADRFLADRVCLHQEAKIGNFADCTDAERWARKPTFAVQREHAKRAWRVFNSMTDAKSFRAQAGGEYVVVERPGQQVRCESYCPVMKFCDQAKRLGVTEELAA